MSRNFKKMISYYRPYMGIFSADMFFAFLSAAIALTLPLIVRYVTRELIYKERDAILHEIGIIAVIMFALLAIDAYSKFFIGYYGHVMGTKIEYDMRADIFDHMQKLSFSFFGPLTNCPMPT